jgi:hypothetical protein
LLLELGIMNNVVELRRELRVDPVCEQVFWRQQASGSLTAAGVRNLSESGISFLMHASQTDVPRVGDRIQVRFLHHTRGLRAFVVKWIGQGKAGMAVGCSRVDFSVTDEALVERALSMLGARPAMAA